MAAIESPTRNNGLQQIRFDLGRVDTYHTRPMSEAWSQLRDVDRLSDGRVDIDFVDPAERISAASGAAGRSDGSVSGQAQFRREVGFAVAELEVTGSVQLVCQRCLAPMRQPVDGSALIALVATEAEADRVPPEFEPVRAPEGRIRVRDLVEEEVAAVDADRAAACESGRLCASGASSSDDCRVAGRCRRKYAETV